MKRNIRQQLSLFIRKTDAEEIEAIRKKFNPQQRKLIDCHVTLCREDEIENITRVLDNLKNLEAEEITIQFGQPIRFGNGKGVLIPATRQNEEFIHCVKKF